MFFMQRVTQTLAKRHERIQQCLDHLWLIFRRDGDNGKKQVSHTPSTDIMLNKLEAFVACWKDVHGCPGKRLFMPDTFYAIDNLKRHIQAGCLSDIPPEEGTNKNERLHFMPLSNRTSTEVELEYYLPMHC